MLRLNSIFKNVSLVFVKIFFILSFLFSGFAFSYAQCDPATGVCLPGQIEAENVRTAELAAQQAKDKAVEAAKQKECNGADNFNCYTLLESFGAEDGKMTTVKIDKTNLGEYLEQIMTYMLMIVTIAAVFFMIYGGVLYLTTDIVNKKAEGKEMITRVVIGLIFVFSVWTIMNSINSGLLKNSLNFSLEGLGKAITSAITGIPSAPSTTTPTPTTPTVITGTCTEGVVDVQNGYKLCSTVADKMKGLLALATKEGVSLELASGYRDPQRQIELRKKNCGTTDYDIYRKPSRLCNPQTAIPGTSNHEKGVAVDFKNMSSKNANYEWLLKNAPTYGFYNNYVVTKEYWHWSVNGR